MWEEGKKQWREKKRQKAPERPRKGEKNGGRREEPFLCEYTKGTCVYSKIYSNDSSLE